MQSSTMISHLSQRQLIADTSMHDLLSKSSGSVGPAIEPNRLKRDHPGVEFLGLVGFDTRGQRFVFLQIAAYGEEGAESIPPPLLTIRPDETRRFIINSGEERRYEDTQLSRRQQEVLQLVAGGLANDQIARKLVISKNTVKVHLRNIFDKLQVRSRTEAAVIYTMRQGWLTGI